LTDGDPLRHRYFSRENLQLGQVTRLVRRVK